MIVIILVDFSKCCIHDYIFMKDFPSHTTPHVITVDVPVGGIYFVTYEWLLQTMTPEGKS